jgi:hypothetical protein
MPVEQVVGVDAAPLMTSLMRAPPMYLAAAIPVVLSRGPRPSPSIPSPYLGHPRLPHERSRAWRPASMGVCPHASLIHRVLCSHREEGIWASEDRPMVGGVGRRGGWWGGDAIGLRGWQGDWGRAVEEQDMREVEVVRDFRPPRWIRRRCFILRIGRFQQLARIVLRSSSSMGQGRSSMTIVIQRRPRGASEGGRRPPWRCLGYYRRREERLRQGWNGRDDRGITMLGFMGGGRGRIGRGGCSF